MALPIVSRTWSDLNPGRRGSYGRYIYTMERATWSRIGLKWQTTMNLGTLLDPLSVFCDRIFQTYTDTTSRG